MTNPPIKPMPDALERLRTASGQETVTGNPRLIMSQAAAGQHRVHVLGALLRAGHQADVVTKHVGDHTCQQRIVRAAQDQRVDIGLLQGLQILLRARQQLGTARDPSLDE